MISKTISQNKAIVLTIVLVIIGSISFLVNFLNLKVKEEAINIHQIKNNNIKNVFYFKISEKIIYSLLEYQKEYEKIPKNIEINCNNCFILPKKLTILISYEKERININQSDEEELVNFLKEEGFTEEQALIMAESLLDWRDQDEESRSYGAENSFYEQFFYKPSNRKIENFSEILLIRGFNPYYFWVKPRLFDNITIYNVKNTSSDNDTIRKENEEIVLKEGEIYRLILKSKEQKNIYTLIFQLKNRKVQKIFETFM